MSHAAFFLHIWKKGTNGCTWPKSASKRERQKDCWMKPSQFVPTLENLVERVLPVRPNIEEELLCCYLWGSRVYGLATETSGTSFFPTNTDASDWDFQVVVTDPEEDCVAIPKENLGQIEKTHFVWDDGIVNVKFVPLKHWKVWHPKFVRNPARQ